MVVDVPAAACGVGPEGTPEDAAEEAAGWADVAALVLATADVEAGACVEVALVPEGAAALTAEVVPAVDGAVGAAATLAVLTAVPPQPAARRAMLALVARAPNLANATRRLS